MPFAFALHTKLTAGRYSRIGPSQARPPLPIFSRHPHLNMQDPSPAAATFTPLSSDDIRAPDALARVFAVPRLRRAFRRIVRVDSEDLVTHPLKKPLLVEFEEPLCVTLAETVPAGVWRSGGAYLLMTRKRSGLFRELVFPTLVDSLVGRCLVDALEPEIKKDDAGKTFSGRTHFSNERATGDYTSWFSVWRDFTAAIDTAASSHGFTYIYESDVSDFFPSIDRTRALEMIAQRTGAHASVLALLRYCLESWLPRFQYSLMMGIPIDCHDVSSLVAHNYLKTVDRVFVGREDCTYLRYVDDTVVFVQTKQSAVEISRTHHMMLREVGLNPNASKTRILPVEDYQEGRHTDVNRSLRQALERRDRSGLSYIVNDWYSRDRRTTESWDKVARHAYSVARQLRSEVMRGFVFSDIEQTPSLAGLALKYLCRFELSLEDVQSIQQCLAQGETDLGVRLSIAQCCADGRFQSDCSRQLADMALNGIYGLDETTPGIGYLRAVWLLALSKHGNHKQRTNGLRKVRTIRDEQVQLHAALVSIAHAQEIPPRDVSLPALGTSDHQLLWRLCMKARRGDLKRPKRTLDACVSSVNGSRCIAARHLPLAAIVMQSDQHRDTKERWLKELLAAQGRRRVEDEVVRQHIKRWLLRLTA